MRRLKSELRKVLLVCGCLWASGPAMSQWFGSDHAASGAEYSRFAASSGFANQSIINGSMLRHAEAARRSSQGRDFETISTTAPRGARPRATSRELAVRFPVAQRAQIERAFNEAFVGYQKLETHFGIPRHDVAGAVAAFIAGNYMAYHNIDFPDEFFPVLVEQVHGVLVSNPVFTLASAADKRQLYEQMAIVGTFMAVTHEAFKRNPNPRAEHYFRQTAQANLEQFLNTDVDRVQIADFGLMIR